MSISGQNSARRSTRLLATCVTALLVVLLTWLRFAPPSAEADLYPVPDAIQYSATAWNISHGLGFSVTLDGKTHPPRYPIGFPLTLAPAFLLGGTELHHASVVVLATSLLLFLPMWTFASRLFGAGAAFWAVLFVGLSPLLIEHSTRVMSEALTILLVAGIYALEARGAGALCLGLMGGFAASVRYTNIVALLPTLLRIVGSKGSRGRVMGFLGLAAGASAFLAPMALQRARDFGSLARDGYHYWHPDRYENAGFVFDLNYAWKAPVVTWTRRPEGLLERYAQDLAGLSRRLYSPLVPILALAGVALTLAKDRKRIDLAGSASAGSVARFLSYPAFLYLFYSFYYGEDRRFLLPALIPIAALAGGAADAACRHLGGRRSVLLAVVLAAGLVWTSEPRLLRGPQIRPQLRHFYVAQYDRLLPQNAVLISSLDVLYLEYYWRRMTERQVVALGPGVPHATVIAPHTIPPNPHGSLRPDAFRLWALAHGAVEPIPIWRPGSGLRLRLDDRPLFLDLASHESAALRRFGSDGFSAEPLSPPGPRRLYRLRRLARVELSGSAPD